MLLSPRRTRYRKPHRPDLGGVANRGTEIAFGQFGLQAMGNGWISARQIESARRAMTRHIRRGGQVWIRIFPHNAITNHGSEAGMGSGKGAVDYYAANIKEGRVMFEMAGVTEELAKEAMRLAAHKLSIKTRFIVKDTAS